ncbi:Similar to hypothetical protein CH063_00602 [Colletotrichum higginsianum]; acc. no. CCF46311 [Pyronema omphalodes CBS 100304]|uniref:Uncharacterized protein n=1 Tax=Pyronema omphalodes (strain CBS 100304) TaxID=1076935 RepID=U4LN99_PYROM|nr:Similar to hypothetical protein CH063_00602 [Colletotrichum higginsianum]; acc. no. CCF46311 [Pyronema omphalodes CBS 100304]
MLRSTIKKQTFNQQIRTFTMSRYLYREDNPIHGAADNIGKMHNSNPKNPNILSSGGAIGKQFNPDGALGSIPQSLGGPFDKDGIIGSQFNAAKGGIAGTVERAVDGPSQAKKNTKMPEYPKGGKKGSK